MGGLGPAWVLLQVTAYLGTGEVFGELALLTGSPRSATVRSPEHAVVFAVEKAPDGLAAVVQQAAAAAIKAPEVTVSVEDLDVQKAKTIFDDEFDVFIARAERFSLGPVAVPVVGRLALLAMKERAGADSSRRKSKRLRDQADAELRVLEER